MYPNIIRCQTDIAGMDWDGRRVVDLIGERRPGKYETIYLRAIFVNGNFRSRGDLNEVHVNVRPVPPGMGWDWETYASVHEELEEIYMHGPSPTPPPEWDWPPLLESGVLAMEWGW